MKLIEDYMTNNEINWHSLFFQGQFDNKYKQNKELRPLIDFLCEKISFWYYKDIFSENPFGPLADYTISGGNATSDTADLIKKDISKIKECINHTKHHLILGFLNDILGVVKNNTDNKLIAAKHFIEYSKDLLNNKQYDGLALPPIKRAFALLCQLKKTKDIENFEDEFLTYNVFDDNQDYSFKVSLIEMFYKHNQKIYAKILSYALDLYEKYGNNPEYLSLSIKLSKIIYKIYKSYKDTDNIKQWLALFAENCCKANFNILQIDYEINYAIKETNKLNDFALTNKLRIKKKQLQQELYKSLNMSPVDLNISEKVDKTTNAIKSNVIKKLKGFDGILQFCYLLTNFKAYSKAEIERELNKKTGFNILDLVNKIIFNENNEIVFQSTTASEQEKTEHETYELYSLHDAIVFDLLINPFLHYIKLDECLIALIKEIIYHNEIIHKNHNVIFESIIDGISNKHIRSALYEILPQFENGTRNYIENQGVLPIIQSGGHEIVASLGQMMNTAIFRSHIDNLLGEDLSQHIDYLACKKLGGDLRNKYAHEGHGEDSQFSIAEVTLFFLLIKAYCLGYDNEIN